METYIKLSHLLPTPEGGRFPCPGLGTALHCLQLPESQAWKFQVCTQDEDFPLSALTLLSVPHLYLPQQIFTLLTDIIQESTVALQTAPKWPAPHYKPQVVLQSWTEDWLTNCSFQGLISRFFFGLPPRL